MATASSAFAAIVAASVAIATANAAPSAAPQAGNAKLLAFRTLCADEGRKVGLTRNQDYVTPGPTGRAHMDEFFADFSNNPGARADAKEQFQAALKSDTTPFHRANMGLMACTIYFTEAYEIGIPASVMPGQWRGERSAVYKLAEPAAQIAPQADEPSPALIMARSVCFDEVRAFEDAYVKNGGTAADAQQRITPILERVVVSGPARDNLLKNGRDLVARATTPVNLAGVTLSLCGANVGLAADSGVRDLNTFKERWESARPSAAPAPPVSPAVEPAAPRVTSTLPASTAAYRMRAVRSVCSDEIKRFTDEHARTGPAPEDVERVVADILETMLDDAEPRTRVLDDFDAMARDAVKPLDAARLSLSACAASVGTLWSMGMRTSGEMNGFWNGRGSARFVIPGFESKTDAIGCIWVEFDAPPNSSQGTFRNTCNFTVDLRFCAVEAAAGSGADTIACEKGLSRFERVDARGSLRVTPAHGNLRWFQCKAPQQPVQTSAPGAAFSAACK